MVLLALACAAVLISTAALAVVVADEARAGLIVYGVCLIASLALFSIALLALLGISDRPSAATLPLGIPWLGAHFRLDALSAFFLAVVNLGAAAASLFALGYGRHEDAPRRVLPFYPAFLAGMSIVVLADDAFTFLVSWEFMSLSSWALVMAHHRVGDNVRAGYVYLVMASFGTLALLLTFGLLAGPDGGYAFADMRAAHPSAGLAALVLILVLIGAGSKAGLVPLHVWLPLAHPAPPSHASRLPSRPTAWPGRRRWRSPPACCTCSTIRCSRASCSSAPARCLTRPGSATWSTSAASSTACRRRRSSS